MNTPNPLIPQGTFPDSRGRSHIRIAVFAILAVHVVLLGGLLMLGCRKPAEQEADKGASNSYPPIVLSEPPSNPPVVVVPPSTPPSVVVISNPPSTGSIPPTPQSDILPPSSGTEHVVVKGDSFYTLGKKYGVSTKAIAEANPGVDSSRLKLGQKLKIPAGGAAPTAASALVSPSSVSGSSGAEKTYSVKSGDNLLKIAKANGTSVKALRSANALKTDQIKVGQKLKIPAKSAPAVAETIPTPATPPTTGTTGTTGTP